MLKKGNTLIKNKIFHTLLFTLLIISSIVHPVAAISELAAEGLDLAAEIASGQDATAGMQKYAKDKYSDWMWQAAGGYENLWNGNIVGESYIEQIKGKFDKIQIAIDLLSKLALAIDSGNYDEGLYHTVEAAVSVANHPLVNATWAAAKLTYESHMMVKSTEAERQISILFHHLHKDRRLFAAEEGEMKQIPINKDTVDYFFNEYIVTDFTMRAKVKDYVEVRLNEEWPEESWGSWLNNLRAVGSGVDSSEAEETIALQGEYRNIARGWIKHLMEDVNLEAQRWYSEMKLRKLRAEFEQFRSQFTAFNNDIEGLLRNFLRAKEIRSREEFYREFLVTSDKAYNRLITQLDKSENKKRNVLLDIYEEAGDFKFKVMSYRSQLQWAGMKDLAKLYLEHYRKWIDLRDSIHNSIPPVISETEAIEETFDTNNVWSSEIGELYNILIGDLLGKPEFMNNSAEIEGLKKEFAALFKEGSISDDRDTLLDNNAYDSVMSKWSDIYKKGKDELQSRVNIANRRIDLYNLYRKGGDISTANEKDIQIIEKINSIIKKMSEEGKGSEVLRWFYINDLASFYVHKAVYVPGKLYLDKADNWFAERINLLNQKKSIRQQQYAQIYAYLHKIRDIFLPDAYEFSPYTRYSYYNSSDNELDKLINLISFLKPSKDLSDSEKRIKEFSFSSYQGVSGSILKMPGRLENDALEISSNGLTREYIYEQEIKFEKYIEQSEEAAAIWKKIKLPTTEEIEEIRYLIDKEFSLESLNMLGNEILDLQAECAQIKTGLEKNRQLVENDMENRKSTADWLRDKAFRMNIFFDKLAEKNMIDSRLMSNKIFKVILPEGYAYVGSDPNNYYEKAKDMRGMILAMKPYPHLMQSDELSNLKGKMTDLKTEWVNSGFYNFYKRYAPGTFKTLENILNLKIISDYGAYPPIKAAIERAIVHPALLSNESSENGLALVGFEVIKESNLEDAEKILKETAEIVKGEVDENYRLINEERFIDNIRTISKLLPLTTAVKPVSEDKDSFKLEL